MDVELDFEKRYRLVREIIETIVLTVLMFLIIRMAVQNFNIVGHSMEPNFHDKELVLVDKWSYMFRTPGRGDVVVFVSTNHPQEDYIKRVIGVPGDVITVQRTDIYVNGKLLKETYVHPENQGLQGESFANRVVPPDAYFVLGDNRAGSQDSRYFGCVPKKNIIGRAAVIYWPFGQDNMGLVPVVNSVFADTPQPPATAASLKKCPVITNGKEPDGPIYTTDQPTSQIPLSTSDNSLDLSMVFLLVLPAVFVTMPDGLRAKSFLTCFHRSRLR